MLNPFNHSGTEDEPEIIFDPVNNIFKITGRSLSENPNEFYLPVIKWINEYIQNPNENTHLICNIELFNSSSARKIYEIFSKFEKIKDAGKEISISWYYVQGDSFMEKKGKEFDSIIDIPFEIKTTT